MRGFIYLFIKKKIEYGVDTRTVLSSHPGKRAITVYCVVLHGSRSRIGLRSVKAIDSS